jgi:mannosyl-3-phosphoglycerate phosphatase
MVDLIVFTDLDGSLLNHEDYSFAEARPVLSRVSRNNIPLVFVSSKTRKEIEILQHEMGIREPFIVENGGGIYFPAGYRGWSLGTGRNAAAGYAVIELGVPYARIRGFMARFGSRFGIRGFGDWTVDEIAARTGLPPDKAALAGQREFTEPFMPGPGADMDALVALAAEHGLKITRGGRFYHLIGAGQDKGEAVRTTRELFARCMGSSLMAIGIGDSENDLPMLKQVDIPVLIPRSDGSSLDLRLPRLVIAGQPGCRGWNAAMERILDEFATETTRDI